jgi:hypothetical protein
VCYLLAHPVPGLGIAVPVFGPTGAAALVALLLSGQDAAPLAYISGSLGTLIGTNLRNLDKLQGLGAPVASIGGAGTFDGIFLTGILACSSLVFLADQKTQACLPADVAERRSTPAFRRGSLFRTCLRCKLRLTVPQLH